jgi:hypothetical protein
MCRSRSPSKSCVLCTIPMYHAHEPCPWHMHGHHGSHGHGWPCCLLPAACCLSCSLQLQQARPAAPRPRPMPMPLLQQLQLQLQLPVPVPAGAPSPQPPACSPQGRRRRETTREQGVHALQCPVHPGPGPGLCFSVLRRGSPWGWAAEARGRVAGLSSFLLPWPWLNPQSTRPQRHHQPPATSHLPPPPAAASHQFNQPQPPATALRYPAASHQAYAARAVCCLLYVVCCVLCGAW